MPYYIGAGMPEWDKGWETESGDPPESQFTYFEPWVANTTVLAFPETPGPEPEIPQRVAYHPPPAPKRGFFARLFGKKATSVEVTPQPTPEEWLASFIARQEAAAAHALWMVSVLAARCRTLGVRRVFGSYDGGDENFTDFRGVEISDGRVITAEALGIDDSEPFRAALLRGGRLPNAREEVQRREALAASILGRAAEAGEARCINDFEEVVGNAAAALMGSFDAGEFALHGVLIIDVGACTITDEKSFDVVFGDKKPWET